MMLNRMMASVGLLMTLAGTTALAAGPSTSPDKPYLGTFVYKYGAFVIRAEVPNDTTLTWTVQAGMAGNPSETCTVQRRAVRPDIFLATWVEKSGAAVTQVSDFTNMTATSSIVQNGKSTVFVGTIERVKD
jgi:hypothetical protein